MHSKLPIVSIVDDDESVCQSLEDLLTSVGIPTESFDSAEEFLESGKHRSTACLITDLHMLGLSGLELQDLLVKQGQRIPTIFITAHNEPYLRARAMRSGAIAFLTKPVNEDILLETLSMALKREDF